MQEATIWILSALADAPRHGYGVIREVEKLSGGQVRLLAGTLYGALDRLAADGLIAVDREEVVDGRNRRYYRLTEDGAAALEVESERLRRAAEAAEAQLAARRRLRPAHRVAW
ncbi:PadR family transcriptional regulator [Catenuloplanes sp. NPDC051500]|uniref:PadR family transcriptional regulator n=1 Tax=Catenuloplanes sp. NPDC051500 TaxID=3363959 RepID=UPI00378BCC5D